MGREPKCKCCGLVLESMHALGRHYNEVHPDERPKKYDPNNVQFKRKKPDGTVKVAVVSTGIKAGETFFDYARKAEDAMRKALQAAEHERDMLSAKVLELDNKVAKYRKMVDHM